MNAVFKLLMALVVPVLLLAGAFFLAADLARLPDALRPLLPWLPYIFCFSGAALAWRFKRSRSVFLLLLLAGGCWITTSFLPEATAAVLNVQLGYAATCFLLPLNFGILQFLEDRGVLTGWGMLHFGAIFAQAVGVLVLMASASLFAPQFAATVLGRAQDIVYLRLLPEWFDAWTFIPQAALLLALVVVLGLLVHLALAPMARDAMHGALITTIVCAMAGLHHVAQSGQAAVFFSAGAIIVTLSLFQESYSMAFADELTGLPARRALMADCKKLGRKYAIAMCDIDHFKKFNDTYGHDVGDDVLRMVAGHLARVTGGGRAYRYGGEEFTVLFPKATAAEAVPHLDALRQSIAGAEFRIRGPLPKKARGKSVVSVTMSVGVAERTDEAATTEAVIKRADNALYKAKKAGRNKVVAG
ncbi:GGDEF domain-containing protein [Desulfovibrio psychrotolerans]|uniref:diguanylate cyclase n=1 Tax=Desulfovibrio psychrotolerans TaxID=415242 RepID=A0A7J0BZI4_9BACT|nr:GGDEF domain-containing protein [Desulfovibrio psychrotolerans]GFM38551.1 GGDEF domain-containing protein [Desulfovibrio psychrotolerans]